MRKKHLGFVAACALALAVMMSACGAKNGGDSAAAGTEAAETAADSTADTAEDNAERDRAAALIEAIDPKEPDTLGTVKLGKYKELDITVNAKTVVTDDSVDYYITQNVLPAYTESAEVVAEGDTVNIDYAGELDGVAFDGGTAEDYDLTIGSHMFIDGFESGLIGAKLGDTVELPLTFPADYFNADLAGKEVVFTVTINDISRPRALDDALAKEIDDTVSTAEEYRAKVRELLQKQADFSDRMMLYAAAVEAAVANAEVTVTDEAVEWKIDDAIKNYYEPQMSAYGVSLADAIQVQGQTYEEFREVLREAATSNVEQVLVLDAIADAEGIEATEENIQAYADESLITVDMMKSTWNDEELKQTVREYFAGKLVAENANVTYTENAEQ